MDHALTVRVHDPLCATEPWLWDLDASDDLHYAARACLSCTGSPPSSTDAGCGTTARGPTSSNKAKRCHGLTPITR